MDIPSLLDPHCWGVYDAKNRFSELLRAVEQRGAQTILRHQQKIAVIVSFEQYARMQRIVKAARAEMQQATAESAKYSSAS